MATSPSAAPQSSSMEETQQQHQPTSLQPEAEAAVTSQPASAEQHMPTSTADASEAKQTDEVMEHLTVISECTETSEYTCKSLLRSGAPHPKVVKDKRLVELILCFRLL